MKIIVTIWTPSSEGTLVLHGQTAQEVKVLQNFAAAFNAENKLHAQPLVKVKVF